MAGFIRTISVLFIFTSCFAPISSANAQDAIVTEVSSRYEFGEWLEIDGRIDPKNPPQAVTLFLQPENQASRQIIVTADPDGNVLVKYDLNQDPLNPFSRIYYWYRLDYPGGSHSTTPSFWFDYIDNRYEWRSTSSKLFEVYWTNESSDYGQKLIEISTRGLEKATGLLSVAPELPIRVYVYADTLSLQEALSISHQPWTAGHASPELGVILVSNDGGNDHLFELERQIPHELMHILIYQASGSHYPTLPAWFSEGLATYAETYPNPELERTLEDASSSSTLIPLESLCLTFPRDAQASMLSYAESLSLVKYMEETYGKSLFVRMIDSSAEGLSCTQLVKTASGISLEQLEHDWIRSLMPVKCIADGTTLLLALLVVILVIGAGVLLLVRKKKIPGSNGDKSDG